jgi:hypothetical protein
LRGKKVTLGAWVWATQPITVYPFTIYEGDESFSQAFQIGTTPAFYTISTKLAEDTSGVRVALSPGFWKNYNKWTVFYDGLVMVEGDYSLGEVPQFDDPSAQSGSWEGQIFHNLLRNASGETAGFGLKPWIKGLSLELFRVMPSVPLPSLVVNSILDWRGAGWYYQTTAQNLLQTFWAKPGWGHIPLLPFTDQSYFFLGMLTLIGIGGAGVRLLRRILFPDLNVFLFLTIVFAGIWAQTILRGIQSLYGAIFIPSARYAYPVIIPAMLILNAGWQEFAHFLDRWVHLASNLEFKLYFLFFLVLDIAALSTIIYYYYIR